MPVNTHPYTNEEVMAYLDGELAPEAAAEMTAHLAQCRMCQDVAADLQGVSRQLSGWAVQAGGDGIPFDITRSLDEKAKQPTPRGRWQFVVQHRWPAMAAALVIWLVVFVAGLRWFFADRPGTKFAARVSNQRVAESNTSQSDTLAASFDSAVVAVPNKLRDVAKVVDAPPLVIRTADLNLTARNFETLRIDLDRILLQLGGHIAQLNVTSPVGEARNLTATLRVPSVRLDAALAELRKLGRVNGESLQGEEVTQQSVDLEARLNNARHTEERLTQILATRTGRLSDVLEVEQKIAEVRGEIERAEAEQKSLNNRISFATVSLVVAEDYRAPLTATATPSATTRLSNAAVRGLRNAFNGLLGLLLLLLRTVPSVLLFGGLLALPGYFLWKKLRHR